MSRVGKSGCVSPASGAMRPSHRRLAPSSCANTDGLPSGAPLLDALEKRVRRQDDVSFHVPGHKSGAGVHLRLHSAFGSSVFRHDLTELPGLDCLSAASGPILEAEGLAARLFGAARTFFIVNGCSAAVQASILATCRSGDALIIARNAHLSAVTATVLSGCSPQWVAPAIDARFGVAHGVDPAAVGAAIRAAKSRGERVGAALITSPTYYGCCSDVAAIARECHSHGIPLIVDEAHGAHLSFLPREANGPKGALEQGADLVAQSTHKVLGSMTQSAMLHVGPQAEGRGVDLRAVERALQLVQSTSPSYILMASLDSARLAMEEGGARAFDEPVQSALRLREALQSMGYHVMNQRNIASGSHCPGWDPLRLTVSFPGCATPGSWLTDELEKRGVVAEMSAPVSTVLVAAVGTRLADAERAVAAFQEVLALPQRPTVDTAHTMLAGETGAFIGSSAQAVMTPREAWESRSASIPLRRSAGRISASLICPYPPGIPVLAPGEIIEQEMVDFLCSISQVGYVTGLRDGNIDILDGFK